MLARLELAFVGQRQFLDDAGHELKTPLTVLRGHLELLDPDDPDEVAETRALLLDEIDRMARLVGDLILLAKTDRPDFLAPSPVSVERLTHTLLSKARGLADRDWQLDGAAEGIVVMDEQRITQAVLQLADNAVKHTETGDTIAIGSEIDGRRCGCGSATPVPACPSPTVPTSSSDSAAASSGPTTRGSGSASRSSPRSSRPTTARSPSSTRRRPVPGS